jgi:hypothetical protein
MHSDRASWLLKATAFGGLLFLHLPILLIFLYAFTTEERSFQFPPPGPDHAMVRHRLVRPARHLAAALAVVEGCRHLDRAGDDPRHAGRRRDVARALLRARPAVAA